MPALNFVENPGSVNKYNMKFLWPFNVVFSGSVGYICNSDIVTVSENCDDQV